MEIQSPKPGTHDHDLAHMFAVTFSDYWSRLDYCTDGYIAESPYDYDASRIAVENGTMVAHFGVWDMPMRIRSCVVRNAGIGGVATLRTHRGRGLMAKTASDCVGSLADAGYDVSLLFGIPDFYHRFGYVVSFSEVRFVVRTKDLKPPAVAVEYELFEGDIADLAPLYNAENESVTGTYVRPTYRLNRRHTKFRIYQFENGYVVCGADGEKMQVADCAGDPATVEEIVRRQAVADVCPSIEYVFLPPRSRMGEYLREQKHELIAEREPQGGPMMKIVNLRSTFEKIVPALNDRLAESPLASYSGTLAVYGDGQGIVLGISGGEVGDVTPAAVDVTANGTVTAGVALVRLLIGDGDPARVCRQGGIELSGDAAHLVPILFPDQEPSTILWDRF